MSDYHDSSACDESIPSHTVASASQSKGVQATLSVKYAKSGARILVKACRGLGDDVQLHVGLGAIAAGLGFRRWNELKAQLAIVPNRGWSLAACRDRMIELLPDVTDEVLDGALAVLVQKWRPASWN